MKKNYMRNLIKNFRNLKTKFADWSSRQEAKFAFASFGKNITWSSQIDWQGPENIYIQDSCTLMRFVNIYASETSTGQIVLEPKVVVSNNVLLQSKIGNIEVGGNSFIGDNTKISAIDGNIHIGKNVTIGHDVEILANGGDIIIGNDVHIDQKCLIHGNGIDIEGQKSRGLLDIGNHTYIGYGSILEADGGYIRTENDVKIDYQNIIGGKGGVHFEPRAHLRHSNYVDAFKEEIRFGEHVTIGQKCIFAGRGSIKIGAKSMIGGLTFMVSENHKSEQFDIPYRYQGHNYQGITLEENVWVGGQSLVLDGVTIGTGSIIGGGAVVVNNIEPWSFAVGIPAQRKRDIRAR